MSALYVVLGLILPWLVVAFVCLVGLELIRQNGRILVRLETLEQMLAGPPMPEPLPVGTEAPAFALADLSGNTVSLQDYQGRRVLLTFYSPSCPYCVQMAPGLAALSEGHDGAPAVVIVTSGTAEENQFYATEHQIPFPILIDAESAVATEYRSAVTPAGYLIDEHGRIASERAVGEDVLKLVTPLPAAPGGGNGSGPVSTTGRGGTEVQPDQAHERRRELRLPFRLVPAEGIGVGDVIKRMTDAIGIKACRGCEERRQSWNRWVLKGPGNATRQR